MLIKLPKHFFYDHLERDLPAPTVVRETARHCFVDQADPELDELLSDARHYAEDVDGCERGLVLSARATVKALTAALVSSAA